MGHAEGLGAALLRVELAYSPAPDLVDRQTLHLAPGATVADALQASGVLQRHPELALATLSAGVWCKAKPLEHLLRDGDRVEVYRPLKVDPKEARRLRYKRDGKAKRVTTGG